MAKKGKKTGKHVFVSLVNKHNNYPLFEILNRHATQHCKLPDELIEAKDTEEMIKAARHTCTNPALLLEGACEKCGGQL